jgi:glycosyltransferase involved in cell wall biosynthesis
MTDSSPGPQVSVLIPCWNAADAIARAVASVLDTPGLRVECVVVDDGSTDGSAELVAQLAERDPRIVPVRSPVNVGPSAARNLGLPLCRGEWLTFVDSDDRVLPGGLAAMHRAATTRDALAVVGQRIWSDGERTWISWLYNQPDIRSPGRKSLVRNPGLMYYASGTGKLFHRSVIEGLQFEGRVLGDQPWTLRALLRAGDRIEVIGDTVYEWTRPRSGSGSTSITEAKRHSAALAAAAVVVAIGALREVCAEADRVLPDEVSRRIIGAGYLERLVRSDFAGPVSRALASRDPGTGRLFEALHEFIAAAPPELVTRSDALVDRVLRPPLAHWDRLPLEVGPAYWAMVDLVLPPAGAMPSHPGRRRTARTALSLARTGRGRTRMLAAWAVLTIAWLGHELRAALTGGARPPLGRLVPGRQR